MLQIRNIFVQGFELQACNETSSLCAEKNRQPAEREENGFALPLARQSRTRGNLKKQNLDNYF